MHQLLEESSLQIGHPPRSFSVFDKLGYLRMPRPLWLKTNPKDKMSTLFTHKRGLMQNGIIVWGHILQANYTLFTHGKVDSCGEIVFSLAPPRSFEPSELGKIAHNLFSLREHNHEDPDHQFIADYLDDGRVRVFGHPVPQSISPHFPCMISSTFFYRKHLPHQRLATSLFPCIVLPTPPHPLLPLPYKYWPDNVRKTLLSHPTS